MGHKLGVLSIKWVLARFVKQCLDVLTIIFEILESLGGIRVDSWYGRGSSLSVDVTLAGLGVAKRINTQNHEAVHYRH